MSQLSKSKEKMLEKKSRKGQTQQLMEKYQAEVHSKIISLKKYRVAQSSIANSPKSKIEQIQKNYDNLSPQFARTQRINTQKNWQDLISEYQVEQISKKPRRFTQAAQSKKSLNLKQNQLSFSQNKGSVQNENINSSKKTVRVQKISLIIAPVSVRLAFSPVKPKECLKEYIEKQYQQENHKMEGFKDYMFPGRQSIVYTKRVQYQEEGLVFERLSRIYQKNIMKIVQFSEPTYLIEGKYTSPAVYSALTILAEDPTRLPNIFFNQTANETGMYYLQLCKDGVWRYIVVDDYVPIKMSVKKTLLFLHTVGVKNTFEIWPCLIQKALAKIYGTYQDVHLCRDLGIRDIFRILTGYPVSEYSLVKDFRSYLFLIDNAIKKKQIVVLQKIHSQLQQISNNHKININKSYMILEVKKNYIIIRNLDEGQLITKMTLEEIMIFSKLLIFKNEKNYVYISQTLRHKKSYYSILNLTVKDTTKCYLDIWENNPVYYKKHLNSSLDYKISKYQIRIKMIEDDKNIQDNEEEILTESGKQIILKVGIYEILHLAIMDSIKQRQREQRIDKDGMIDNQAAVNAILSEFIYYLYLKDQSDLAIIYRNNNLIFKKGEIMIRFILLQNRQGKTRLSKWFVHYEETQKVKLQSEIHRMIVMRDSKQTNFIQFHNFKIIYKRYAGLYFALCIDVNDNQLLHLELIHLLVETLDQYFGNVCQLDIVFNFNKVYGILDQMIVGGQVLETSKSSIVSSLKLLEVQD